MSLNTTIQNICIFPTDTNGSDNSIPMAYLTLDHQLQVNYCVISLPNFIGYLY